ncbi:MAG TPA: hypothetical protein VNV85_13720 [Puia sp.]|nr:hypothetical protein [Puia sp.]
MKFLLFILWAILIPKTNSKLPTDSNRELKTIKNYSVCLTQFAADGNRVGVSNACPYCMKGTITWQTKDSTQFQVGAKGTSNDKIYVKFPSAPNSGNITRQWKCN